MHRAPQYARVAMRRTLPGASHWQRTKAGVLVARTTATPASLTTMAMDPSNSSSADATFVHKFGGSSMGSADAIRNVAHVLTADHQAGNKVIGVCSAVYSVTNRLLAAVQAAEAGDMSRVGALKESVADVHFDMAEDLIDDSAVRAQTLDYLHHTLSNDFDSAVETLAEAAATSASDGESGAMLIAEEDTESGFARDFLSSLGERFSTRLLAAHLTGSLNAPAEFFSGDEVIVTDGVPGNSMPDMDATREACATTLMPVLEEGAIACVTGFYGRPKEEFERDPSRRSSKVTTFGRGGSDLSAAVLGRVCEADAVSLWKVECTEDEAGWMQEWEPGFAGVVHDKDVTETVPHLAYEEAAQLAHFGKAVLHPETVTPIVEASIPIRVRNSFDPTHPGTTICRAEDIYATRDTSDDGAAAVDSDSEEATDGEAASVTKTSMAKYEAKFGPIGAARLRNELATGIEIDDSKASIVSIVGYNLLESSNADGAAVQDPEVRVGRVLNSAGIPAAVPSRVNGSVHNICVVVPGNEAKRAVKVLHEAFCQ